MAKSSQIGTTLAWSPLFVFVIATIGTQIFSDAATKWAEIFGAIIGYRLLFLICLFLIAGAIQMFILLKRDKESTIGHGESDVPHLKTQVAQISERELHKKREKLLNNLSIDEKETLRLFIEGNKKTIEVGIGDQSFGSLLNSGIMFAPPQYSIGHIEYCISNWAWEMLKENPKYLK